jgi:hypothetical protein
MVVEFLWKERKKCGRSYAFQNSMALIKKKNSKFKPRKLEVETGTKHEF